MKTVVVTGAAQGVGLAAASLLGALGYRVILVDLNSLEEQVRGLREAGAVTTQVMGQTMPSDKPGMLSIVIEQPRQRLSGSLGPCHMKW